jgi:hypothetical protein
MRDVDTQALDAVARALGVGNPATATQAVAFDDDNLQQAFDVGDLIRYASADRFPGLADGWQIASRTLPTAAATAFQNLAWDIFTDLGADPDKQVVWVYDVQLFCDFKTATLNTDFLGCVMNFQAPDDMQVGPAGFASQVLMVIADGTNPANDRTMISATTAFMNERNPKNLKPIPLYGGGNILLSLGLDAAAPTMDLTPILTVRVLPKGVPPSAF